MRPLKPAGVHRSLSRVIGRTRNLERRFVDSVPAGASTLLFKYVVPGGGQAGIDTNSDGPMAGTLSQAYDVLEVFFEGRTTEGVAQSTVLVTFNGDTGTHYDLKGFESSGGTVVPVNQTNDNNVFWPIPGASANSGHTGMFRFSVPNYADATLLQKAGEGFGGFADGSNSQVDQLAFFWRPTSVAGIDRVHALGAADLIEGSVLYVYGR